MGLPFQWKFFTQKKKIQLRVRAQEGIQINFFFPHDLRSSEFIFIKQANFRQSKLLWVYSDFKSKFEEIFCPRERM